MRQKLRVRQLAEEANRDIDEVLILLLDSGFDLENENSYISKSRCAEARRILGLPSHRVHRSVAKLAQRAGLDVEEVRTRLKQAGIGVKATSTVPRRQLREAERALSLEPIHRGVARATAAPPVLAEPAERPRKRKATSPWAKIGNVDATHYLTAKDVEQIHWRLVEDFARSRDPMSPPGVRDQTLLESAIFRPHTALGSERKYPTLSMAGAALFHSLVTDHAFHNGNKRTAVVALLVFLDKHGYVLTIDENELFDIVLRTASHELVVDDAPDLADAETLFLARWLQGKTRRVRKEEMPVKFRELRRILSYYDCVFDKVVGRIWIQRGRLRTQVFYGDEGREVPQNLVHKVRRDLELDEEHGYDSDIFYNGGPRISDFINKYRGLLTRLAKV